MRTHPELLLSRRIADLVDSLPSPARLEREASVKEALETILKNPALTIGEGETMATPLDIIANQEIMRRIYEGYR